LRCFEPPPLSAALRFSEPLLAAGGAAFFGGAGFAGGATFAAGFAAGFASAFTSAFGDGAFCFFGEVGEASAFRLAGSAAALAGSVFTSSFGAGAGTASSARCARGMSSSESSELSGMPDYSETDLPRGNGMW